MRALIKCAKVVLVWRFLSSYVLNTSDFRNLRIEENAERTIFKPHEMNDKPSVLIDREVRKSFDPGITNFAIGTLA